MILSSLLLQHFRSYPKRLLTFSPAVTLIVGPNTVGKTNVIEAIYVMATGKSFRADTDNEMIAWDSELARVTAAVGDTKLELVLTRGQVAGQRAPTKKYMVNGVPRRMVDFVGNLRAVRFWPQDLELVTDSPGLRRRYLDSVLVQIDREYRRNLLSYERGLRQRNKLLDLINEGKAARSQLLFWDQLLIKAGGYITDKRAAYIHFINQYPIHNIQYSIVYDKSVISQSRLEQYKDAEVGAKATLVGPHRDDFIMQVQSSKFKVQNNTEEYLDLSKYGSRGEQRLAILWLKLAELTYVQSAVGDRPILLLDDIFSELDESHQQLVVNIVAQQQTILTSADESIIKLIGKQTMVIQL